MSDIKDLLKRLNTKEEPEELSVLDKFYADENKNPVQNLFDYLQSKEYLQGAAGKAQELSDASSEGNIGVGAGIKSVSKPIHSTVRNILNRVKSPEEAQALRGVEQSKYNRALDLAYGNKAKRSSEMGFSPETYYHGTNKDFKEFDPKQLDKSVTREQFWTSDNPDVANVFAKSKGHNELGEKFYKQQENLKPLLDKLQKEYPKKLSNMPNRVLKNIMDDGIITPEEAEAFKSHTKDLDTLTDSVMFNKSLANQGEQVYPLKVRRTNTNEFDAGGQNWQDVAKDIGGEEVLVRDIIEDVRPGMSDESIAPLGNSLAVKDPSQIRSVHAAFDPRFKDSSNLMAGGAGATIGFKQLMDYLNKKEDNGL